MLAHSRLVRFGSAVALVIAGAVAGTVPAAAATLTCGQVITTDIALSHNLVCPAGTDALVIGADNITLDLKGYTISGDGTHAGVRAAQRAGVTITNGTIIGFAAGVVLDQTTGGIVSKIDASHNVRGIDLANAVDSQIVQNTVSGSIHSDGIRLGGAHRTVVAQNVLDDNLWAISVSSTQDARIQRNVVTGARGTGIAIFDGSTGTTIAQNVVTDGWEEGIRTSPGTSGTTVIQNTSTRNGRDGITVDSATVTRNTSTDNGWLGIRAVDSVDGGGNKAAGNGDPAQCVGLTCTAP